MTKEEVIEARELLALREKFLDSGYGVYLIKDRDVQVVWPGLSNCRIAGIDKLKLDTLMNLEKRLEALGVTV